MDIAAAGIGDGEALAASLEYGGHGPVQSRLDVADVGRVRG